MAQSPIPQSAPPPPGGPLATPGRRFTDAPDQPLTVIGRGTHIKGELAGSGPVELAGTLEGDCSVIGLCRVREGGRVTGDVTATNIVVEGEVSGETLVAERVEIGATGHVRATIRARVVAIAEGAFFEGDVQMDGPDAPAAPIGFVEKRKPRREGEDPTGG